MIDKIAAHDGGSQSEKMAAVLAFDAPGCGQLQKALR